MKIILVDPPGKNKGLNTGLGYLAAALKGKHEVHVLDLNNIRIGLCGDPNPDLSEEEMRHRIHSAIDRFDPDIFGVSVKTFTAHTARTIFGHAREKKGKMLTIAGGPHITLDGPRYVKESEIDFGVVGEGESSLPLLCKALQNDSELSDVKGLLYRQDGEIVASRRASVCDELDDLSLPDYMSFSSVQEHGGVVPQYPILTSRGCPFSCGYCSMPQIMGRRWRCHSPEYVMDEITQAKERYGANSFTVVDDVFTLDLKRVEVICDGLISSGLDLRWNSQNGIRADRISGTLAQKMRRSGCYHVWIGIESADEKVFKAINKGEKLANIRRGIETLKGAGIRVGGFFIVGLPHSTRESDLKSIEFVKELKIDAWWFNFVPYPFTAAWEWVQKNARILRSPEGVLQYGSSKIELVFETDAYSEGERIDTYKDIHFRMGYFDRLFDPSLGQLANLWAVSKDIVAIKPLAFSRFFVFILKYNIKLVVKKLRLNLQNLRRGHVSPLTGCKDIDAAIQ